MKTYAAVQHGMQQISIDELYNGKYCSQIAYWYKSRDEAKKELDRLCAEDNVPAYKPHVIGYNEIKN